MLEMSFSQANTYNRCKRAWAYDKVDRRIGLPSLAAIRGNRYHEAIEQMINTGEQSLDPIVSKSTEWLQPLQKMEAEKYMSSTKDNIKVRGYADVFGRSEHDYDIVIDWKFPGKKPTKTAKPDYKKQISLYGFLTGADEGTVAYPEYGFAHTFTEILEDGEEVFLELVETGKDIISSGALETPGDETEPTRNWTCAKYCSYRHVCPMGGN